MRCVNKLYLFLSYWERAGAQNLLLAVPCIVVIGVPVLRLFYSIGIVKIRPCVGFCCWSRPLTYLLWLLLWHCITFSSLVACNVALCQLVLLGYHSIVWTLVGFSALGAIGSGCSVDTIVSITFMLIVLCLFAKAMSWWSFFQRIVSWSNLEYPA